MKYNSNVFINFTCPCFSYILLTTRVVVKTEYTTKNTYNTFRQYIKDGDDFSADLEIMYHLVINVSNKVHSEIFSCILRINIIIFQKMVLGIDLKIVISQ
jgi:hypothetical protein